MDLTTTVTDERRLTRMYFVWADPGKAPAPIRDRIREAIAACRAKYPDAEPDVLLLSPVYLPGLGTWASIDGRTWMCSYNRIVSPREVRVGPVD